MCDTKLRKSMKVKRVLLNIKEGTELYACFSSRPTLAHYWSTAKKLVADLMDQKIIGYAQTCRRL